MAPVLAWRSIAGTDKLKAQFAWNSNSGSLGPVLADRLSLKMIENSVQAEFDFGPKIQLWL
jgi:hypothetical protein